MVDREARDQIGFLLRRLARKRITEDEFDRALEALPLSGQDRLIKAIFEESFGPGDRNAWPFHSQDDLDNAVKHPRLLIDGRV